MKSHRRAVGLSLVVAALASVAVWIAWNRPSGDASTPDQTTPDRAAQRFERNDSSENVAAAAEPDTAMDGEGVVAEASPKVDFSGHWQLDDKASDSLDAILTAIGLSYLQRTLVNNTVVTHAITQTADELTIEVKTSFFNRTDHLLLDGQLSETTDPSGRAVESTSVWSDDGQELITKILVKAVKQNFTLTRSLDQRHDRMEVLVEFFPKEGPTLTSRRVYHRIKPAATGKRGSGK